MLKRLKKRHYVFAVCACAVVLVFQNCAQQAEDTSQSSEKSYQAGLPFAYKATPDTLAYMSCEGMGANTYDMNGYFTFRMGAYGPSAGLTQTQNFFNSTQHYSATDRANLFGTSDVNTGTSLVLAITMASDYQRVMYPTSDGVLMGYSIDTFLPQLDSPTIAGPLAAAAPGVNRGYFPSGDDQRLMEASVRHFKTSDEPQSQMRADFGSSMVLVMGYSDSADIVSGNLRSPINFPGSLSTTPPTSATASNTVFGTAYPVQFGNPAGYGNAGVRVMSAVPEKDLTTGVTSSPWTCPTNYQYQIVRLADAIKSPSPCPIHYYDAATPAQADELSKLRRVLPAEYWYINPDYRCVVPKDNIGDNCYGDAQTAAIVYNSTCSATVGNCPHFVSICTHN